MDKYCVNIILFVKKSETFNNCLHFRHMLINILNSIQITRYTISESAFFTNVTYRTRLITGNVLT